MEPYVAELIGVAAEAASLYYAIGSRRRQAKRGKVRDLVRSRHLQEVLHLGPGIGLKPLERPPVGFRHPVEDRCTGRGPLAHTVPPRSEEHTSELQSLRHLVCRLLLEKKK